MINKELEKKVSDLRESWINGDLVDDSDSINKYIYASDYRRFTPILADDTEIARVNKQPIACFICGTDKKKDFKIVDRPAFATASFWRIKEYYFCILCQKALDDKYGTIDTKKKYNRYKSKWWKFQSSHGWANYLLPPMTEDIENIDNFRETMLSLREKQVELMINAIYDAIEEYKKEKKRLMDEEALQLKLKIECKVQIVDLLKEKNIKMPVSDIDAFLKHQNVEEIKEYCEELYNDGEISFAGNGRYFILTEEKEKPKPKKTSAPKSEAVDVKAELKKYKEMLDDGLITQEDYDAKKKELLGL